MAVPSSGPRNAKLAVVGMAPAREEVRQGVPFVGESGRILNEALSHFGLSREDVFVTNILDHPIPYLDSVYNSPRDVLERNVARLRDELEMVKPNVVLLCGGDPLRAVDGLSGITKWRGSILPSTLVPGLKTVATLHPANFVRGQWKWLPVFKYIDVARAVAESGFPEIQLPIRSCITGPSFNTVRDYLHTLASEGKPVSFDIETTSDWIEISCVGFGNRIDEAICIPFTRGGTSAYWTLEEEIEVWRMIADLLQSGLPLIAQNASFEWLHFWQYGIYPSNLWMDTMTAHHCLYPDFGGTEDIFGKRQDPDNPGHGLAFINSQYTRTPYYKDDGRNWRPEHGDHAYWRYNCHDVMVTLDAALQMDGELRRKGLREFYDEYYLRPFWHAIRMEWDGVTINTTLRDEARIQLQARSEELDKLITSTLGYELNVNSPKQMKKLLYEEKGYGIRKHPKTGKPTADKAALSYYASKKGDIVLEYILEKRQILDLIGDILNQKLDSNNRIHTHYKIGGTNGARWSSSRSILGGGTNLQNVPREGIARRLFLAS